MLLSAGKIEVVTTVSLWIIPKLLKGGIAKPQVGESKLPPARPVHDVGVNQVEIHLIGVLSPQTSNQGVPYDIFAAVENRLSMNASPRYGGSVMVRLRQTWAY